MPQAEAYFIYVNTGIAIILGFACIIPLCHVIYSDPLFCDSFDFTFVQFE